MFAHLIDFELRHKDRPRIAAGAGFSFHCRIFRHMPTTDVFHDGDATPVVFVLYTYPPAAIPPGAYGLGPAGFRGLLLTDEFQRWIEQTFGAGHRTGDVINGTTFSIVRTAGGYAFHEFNN